jgi:hypothetical protein
MERTFPLKDGTTLVREPLGSGPGVQANAPYDFALEIAFGEGQIVDGKPIVPTLQEMTQFVEGAIAIFAKEMFGN